MKLLTFTFLLFLSNHLFSQKTFFDENDKIISEQEFKFRKLKSGEMKVYNDSLQTAKIIPGRSETGEIDSKMIVDDLSQLLNLKIDNNNPTVIIFHPGKDPCNSSGTATTKEMFLSFKENQKKANEITKTNFLYIYKNIEGIKTIKKIKWYKDPKNIVENTFFKYHYPCSSYVILYNNKYTSHFAEFPLEYILNDLKAIVE